MKPLKNIVETARELGAKRFVKYLEDSGLISELANEGPFTLFAPTDEAFQASILHKILSVISNYVHTDHTRARAQSPACTIT